MRPYNASLVYSENKACPRVLSWSCPDLLTLLSSAGTGGRSVTETNSIRSLEETKPPLKRTPAA